MDDDPVLRELADDLDREDPRLAAELRAGPRHRHRARTRLLGALALLGAVAAVWLDGLAAAVALCIVAILATPVLACWWWASAAPLRPPDRE